MSARIAGLSKLQQKLARLPLKVKQRIREAMEEGAKEIVSLARSLVPVDSGDLRDSIGWTWGDAPKGALKIASVKSTAGGMTITVYAGNSEAFYARWVEFGTSAHTAGGKFSGSTIPAIPAQPFFYVSFRTLRRRVKSRMSRATTKAAKEVAAGR
ncbi:HK97 gp10 family phage protein [Neorhizobium huautlense]|uniref:HK97 gp10 family phage protein n=1 Tax=Neorhizobium huautlense TaxID=67774 RepID=A0ABT9PT12_9HYPH|nr:HK97-gp10 family putative phage morphogenesis protein [Neorhizobium huautlense]MDP9837600.1 HK97 gp10 family phage protein [Neorhizobium huautlense]